jgi:hypothetical protein
MKRMAAVAVAITLLSVFSAAQFKLQQVCGAPVVHHDGDGNPDEVSCPSDTPKQCKISLSFLKCLTQQGDPAIRVNPDDQVEWYSDQKENKNLIIFAFDSFTQVGQSDHGICENPKNGDQEPFPGAKGHGYDFKYKENVQHASRTSTCFKQVLNLRDPDHPDGYPLDPHVIIGDGTQLFSVDACKWVFDLKNKNKRDAKDFSAPCERDQSQNRISTAKPKQQAQAKP